jgi:hypothetical protein
MELVIWVAAALLVLLALAVVVGRRQRRRGGVGTPADPSTRVHGGPSQNTGPFGSGGLV